MSLHEHMWRQKSMEARLLIALIVIRNSAFYCDRNVWNLKTWRHKKYSVKTFSCSPELFVTHLTMKKKSKTLCFKSVISCYIEWFSLKFFATDQQTNRQISLRGFFHATSEKKHINWLVFSIQIRFEVAIVHLNKSWFLY